MTRCRATCVLLGLTAAGAVAAPPCHPLAIRAADVSYLPQVEAGGGVFSDGGLVRDELALLSARGFNTVRLRILNGPTDGPGGDHGDGWFGFTQTLQMAARAHAQGLAVWIDFHYSDFGTDPGQQSKPAAWAHLSLPDLTSSIRGYTAGVVAALVAQGTSPAVVQIGNEITGGMLWPEGKLTGGEGGWSALASLLTAASRGVRDGGGTDTLIMLHLDRGGDNATARWWFDHATSSAIPFDVIGLSYYPWWHGPLEAMQSNVNDLATRYSKPVLLAEIAYPWTIAWHDNTNNVVGLPSQVLPGYPATPAGQLAFLNAVRAIESGIPGGLGMGMSYWAPDWLAAPGLGSSWENLTLFDFAGQALPGLSAFADCCPADFNRDGFLDIYDFTDFVTCFESGQCPPGRSGDFNHDGFADIYDFSDFVAAFETGC